MNGADGQEMPADLRISRRASENPAPQARPQDRRGEASTPTSDTSRGMVSTATAMATAPTSNVQRIEICFPNMSQAFFNAQPQAAGQPQRESPPSELTTQSSLRTLFQTMDEENEEQANSRSPGPSMSVYTIYLPVFHQTGIRSVEDLLSVREDLEAIHQTPANGLLQVLHNARSQLSEEEQDLLEMPGYMDLARILRRASHTSNED